MRDVTALFPIPLVWPRLAMNPDDVDAIVIHHTAIDPRSTEPEVALLFPASEMSEEDELNHIRVIHLYHKSLGWGGFAYHIIAFPSGHSYLVVPLSQWGAHVGGKNDTKYGIVAADDLSEKVPPLPQQYAVVEGIDLIDAHLRRQVYVGPHREFSATSCPGAYWWQWVPQLRILAKEEDNVKELTEALHRILTGKETKEDGLLRRQLTALFERNARHSRREGELVNYVQYGDVEISSVDER
jgi:hypothetical protein